MAQAKKLAKTSGFIVKSGKNGNPRVKLLVVTPTLGIVRMEWAMARFGAVIPCNWSASSAFLGIGNVVPMHYLVADAQNIGCQECLAKGFEWLLLWEDDVIAPPEVFLELNQYIQSEEVPVVSGLYFLKGNYSEPILYRGRGTGPFTNFKIGDKVWVDGVPTGMLLVHRKVIQIMYEDSPEYLTEGKIKARQIFKTPAEVTWDKETMTHTSNVGTSDLQWCTRVMEEKVLSRAGWPKIARKKYPFLCNTRIFCKHIDLQSGEVFP